MPWPAAFKAGLWSVLFFAPEVGTIAGAAVMGKENFLRFKATVGRFFRRLGFGKKRTAGESNGDEGAPETDEERGSGKGSGKE
ncbi:hypothetical protein [Haloferula sp. BvORR071]|uniref:hypothetical protein n=1 Tax=Haloferula sp. BvORR071 TaxID=1396141 RepID=UPI00224102C8|nr:hypothetical protein [Haloferula sp. BvORR071]